MLLCPPKIRHSLGIWNEYALCQDDADYGGGCWWIWPITAENYTELLINFIVNGRWICTLSSEKCGGLLTHKSQKSVLAKAETRFRYVSGLAVSETVSRMLRTVESMLDLWEKKWLWDWFLSDHFDFPLPIIILAMLHAHLSSGAGTVGLFEVTVPSDSVTSHPN
jgi:hypothetical protein